MRQAAEMNPALLAHTTRFSTSRHEDLLGHALSFLTGAINEATSDGDSCT